MQLTCNHRTEWTRPFKPSTRNAIRIKVRPIIRCRKCGVENEMPKGFAQFIADFSTFKIFYNPVEILGYIDDEENHCLCGGVGYMQHIAICPAVL